eukprot:907833-Rhodomonas_salina.2
MRPTACPDKGNGAHKDCDVCRNRLGREPVLLWLQLAEQQRKSPDNNASSCCIRPQSHPRELFGTDVSV